MMTVKQLLQSTETQSSPDGIHWEPAIPIPYPGWRYLWRDAWEVLNGRAVAIRQTTKTDMEMTEKVNLNPSS